MNCRVYPIRLTRNSWNIPIYGVHQCSDRCNLVLIPNPENPHYLTLQKISESCQMKNLIERTLITINDFDIFNPNTIIGPLVEPNRIVIPDDSFIMTINFPLSFHVDIHVKSKSKGFTLSELIYTIKISYENIYREEERTSTPLTYNLSKKCIECYNSDLDDLYQEEINKNDDLNCSICFNSIGKGEKLAKLICGHYFHESCIKNWIKYQNLLKSCPLCRSPLKICNNCGNLGHIYYTYYGTIIPHELRGDLSQRNLTNGVYGIYGSDLGDLLLEGLFYDRIHKRLFLSVI